MTALVEIASAPMTYPGIPSLAESIVVGVLQTALEGATVLAPDAPVRSAAKELRAQNYDQAPVVENGQPIGYVLLRDLLQGRGNVGARARPILPNALASDRAPLDDVPPWLADCGFLFVLSANRISGFVVPSDINRQAGRAYFYLAVTALELELAELVRTVHQRRDALSLLTKTDAGTVRKRLSAHVDANVEADVVAEMTLSQLCKVIAAEDDAHDVLRPALSHEWDETWHQINEVRKRVAHPTKPLYQRTDEFGWLVDTARVATHLARHLESVRAEKAAQ